MLYNVCKGRHGLSVADGDVHFPLCFESAFLFDGSVVQGWEAIRIP